MKAIILSIFLLLPLISCAQDNAGFRYYPGINYRNHSKQYIKNIHGTWNNTKLLPQVVASGGSSSHLIPLINPKDFYGPVNITWENESGKKFEKKFLFTENDLPINYVKERKNRPQILNNIYPPQHRTLDIIIEFTVDDMALYTSSSNEFNERVKESDVIMKDLSKTYWDNYRKNHNKVKR